MVGFGESKTVSITLTCLIFLCLVLLSINLVYYSKEDVVFQEENNDLIIQEKEIFKNISNDHLLNDPASGLERFTGLTFVFGDGFDEPKIDLDGANPVMYELLARSQAVQIYSYNYELKGIDEEVRYIIKGDNIRLELKRPKKGKNGFYNVILMDLKEHSASGICEIRLDPLECTTYKNKIFELNFFDYDIELPRVWIEENLYEKKVSRKESRNFDGVNSFLVEIAKSDEKVNLWTDKMYGLPHQVDVISKNNTKRISYYDLRFNDVDDRNKKFM